MDNDIQISATGRYNEARRAVREQPSRRVTLQSHERTRGRTSSGHDRTWQALDYSLDSSKLWPRYIPRTWSELKKHAQLGAGADTKQPAVL